MELLLSKFKVSLEIKEYISYVKFIDKRNNGIEDELVNTIYKYATGTQEIRKEDLSELIHQYSNMFLTNMLKEEKISCYYDVYTNEFIEHDLSTPVPNAPFTIQIEKESDKNYDKDLINNYLSDTFGKDYFILDVRQYRTNKRYINVDFELHLNENGFYLHSIRDSFVEYFLSQYDYSKLLYSLKLANNNQFSNFLFLKDNYDCLQEIILLESNNLLSLIKDQYEKNEFLFINVNLMNQLGIDVESLLAQNDKNKLLILLEKENYDSTNYKRINQNSRMEYIGNLKVLRITETLFREACGYNTHILFMCKNEYYAISKVNPAFDYFTFISKLKINGSKYLSSILFAYQEINREESYLNELMLLAFILTSEELSKYFNFYILNNIKLGHDNKVNYHRQSKRNKLNLNTCKKFYDFILFLDTLGKSITFNADVLAALMTEAQDILIRINDIRSLTEYKEVLTEIVKKCQLGTIMDEQKIVRLLELIDYKKAVREQSREISYIIDTNIFIESPDILNKYFFNKNIIIPSSIIKDLEELTAININATRAVRNINLGKDLHNNSIRVVDNVDMSILPDEFDKSKSDNRILALAISLKHDGTFPIVVTNANVLTLKLNKENVLAVNEDNLKIII